jgi:hypothetical protein
MAAATEVSTGVLAPAQSSLADAQDALDEAKGLAQQHRPQEATEQATQGLEGCAKIDAMVAQARQATAERKVRAHLAAEAEVRIAQTAVCIEAARQGVRSTSTTRTRDADVVVTQGALDRAEAGLKQARALLAQNDPKGALGRADTAQADCQTVQAMREEAAAQGKSATSAGQPHRGR